MLTKVIEAIDSTLLIHAWLSDSEVDYVIKTVKNAL